jgi:hypothetical protein
MIQISCFVTRLLGSVGHASGHITLPIQKPFSVRASRMLPLDRSGWGIKPSHVRHHLIVLANILQSAGVSPCYRRTPPILLLSYYGVSGIRKVIPVGVAIGMRRSPAFSLVS